MSVATLGGSPHSIMRMPSLIDVRLTPSTVGWIPFIASCAPARSFVLTNSPSTDPPTTIGFTLREFSLALTDAEPSAA
jgi:hypothetical protein